MTFGSKLIQRSMYEDRSAREDGRFSLEGRIPKIWFKGVDRCIIFLGRTVVSTKVSAELTQPSVEKPFEGDLHINVEYSDAIAKKANRPQKSIETTECQNYLENCLKVSKCLLFESLCVIPERKVWTIKLDISIRSVDGNLPECTSIAAITALARFKTPAFSIQDSNGSTYECESSPLPILHIPLMVNVALFHNSFLLDPTAREEKNADGLIIMAANECEEFCVLHCENSLLAEEEAFQKLQQIILHRVHQVMQIIKNKLNKKARKTGASFYDNMSTDTTELFLNNQISNHAVSESSQKHREVIIEIVQISKVSTTKMSKCLQVASDWGITDDDEPCSYDEPCSENETSTKVSDCSHDQRTVLQGDTPNNSNDSRLHCPPLQINW